MDVTIRQRPTNMGWHFLVTVSDKKGQSQHNVHVDKDFLLRIGQSSDPEKVVKRSFEFLLEREPRESILQEFDITTISHYYPEFITELEKKLVY